MLKGKHWSETAFKHASAVRRIKYVVVSGVIIIIIIIVVVSVVAFQ